MALAIHDDWQNVTADSLLTQHEQSSGELRSIYDHLLATRGKLADVHKIHRTILLVDPEKEIMIKVSLRTISGKFIFMAALFIAVLTSLTVLIVYQNNQSKTALAGIQQVRIPIRLITGNVIGSLDRVMSQQRAYMLSGNAAFKEERKNVYTNEIYPALSQLMFISENLPSDQQKSVQQIQNTHKVFSKACKIVFLNFLKIKCYIICSVLMR